MAVYRFAYIAVLVAAVVFSQAYAGHLSSVILITVIVLPIVSLALTFMAKTSFTISFDTSAETIEKNKTLRVRIFIKNNFMFPSSSTYISASMPGLSEKKDARLIFSLSPFQMKNLNLTYTAEYRGEYDISFDTVCFYDYFKIFKLKKKLDLHKKITVTPRIIDVASDNGFFAVSDEENENRAINSSKGERSFTRKYAEGDDIRNIHWKLSSKQEDYMVWQNAENLSSQSVIVCDMTAFGATEKDRAVYTDAVLESALAVALYNLKNDCNSLISFYDFKSQKTENIPIEHLSHLYNAASVSATVNSYDGEPSFYTECKKHFTDNKSVKGSAVLITHHGDRELVKLAEELAVFSDVLILIAGETEKGVSRYIKGLRNVTVAELDPWNVAQELPAAVGKIYSA
ncbi:MAG: DUF58 domain-containing protein [Ruminococcaceae bacterium]|nr:DUF58 domain-containing protein [Oscillospiraceae bacterium]